jgi:peptidylprolyl isomerase
MSEAKSGDTVHVHYTGRLDDGSEFDSSAGREPLEITLGQAAVIPGFENAIMGMVVGDTKTVNLTAADAYGPHQPEEVQEVERSMIPAEVNLDVGTRLQATGPDNQALMLTVIAVTDDKVTLDANHPLAGRDLTFDIELVKIV